MLAIPVVVILRHDPSPSMPAPHKYLDYVTWTGSAWQLLRLDIWAGTCVAGPAYHSFVESVRAYRAGIRWEDRMSVYQALLAAGCTMDSHESDLYVKATPDAERIIRAHPVCATRFMSAIDGSLWWDLPFSYEPFWEAKARRLVPATSLPDRPE